MKFALILAGTRSLFVSESDTGGGAKQYARRSCLCAPRRDCRLNASKEIMRSIFFREAL